MEENGIGRPSTYAPTVSTILDREYVVKEGKYLRSTPLGEVVNSLMCDKFTDIVNTGFTADMERKLDDVEEGKIFAQVVMESGWAEHCVYMPISTTMAAAIQTIDHNASFDFVSAVNSLDKLPDLEPYTALLTGANTVGFDFNTNVPDAEGGIPDEVFAAVRAAGLSVSFWGISSSAYTTYFDKGPLRVTSGFANSGLGQMYLDDKQFW
jgi:hypothetical protein